MSSSRLRPALAMGMIALGLMLGACSFQPVYSGRLAEQQGQMNFAYAEPKSRLEQIIYQELAFRFGTSTAPTAPLVTISVGPSASAPYQSVTSNPNTPYEASVTATATIEARDGVDSEPIVLTRRAVAQYTYANQVLAGQQAGTEALERAAKSAAEALRLAILSEFGRS